MEVPVSVELGDRLPAAPGGRAVQAAEPGRHQPPAEKLLHTHRSVG